jgi:methionyl-tRNA formyltransferase
VSSVRLVFFGTPEFAVPTLAALLASPYEVVGVVTQPDKPRGRGQKVSEGPVKTLAQSRGVPVLQPARLAREIFESAFAALGADLGVVAAYGKLLPEWLLATPRLGLINVHASLLPKYRGAAPIHRAVMNGDTETGVTIMRVVKALDAGPMLAVATRPIGPDEPSDSVERDLARLGATLLVETIQALVEGRALEIPQDDARATYAPRLTKEEGRLDFARPATEVHNRVRGLRPWPGAFTFLEGHRLGIARTRLSQRSADQLQPGTFLDTAADAMAIACGDGRAVDVLEVQPEGRRVMTAREYVAGHGRPAGRRVG